MTPEEKRRESNRAQKLRKRYGLSLEDYDRMREEQGGRCQICRKRPRSRLEVDHDHDTGKVRGLLCGACNRAIGLLKDNPSSMTRAAYYAALNQGDDS